MGYFMEYVNTSNEISSGVIKHDKLEQKNYKSKFIDGEKKHPFIYKGIFFQQTMFE
jgi:hypothetical protein